MKDSITKTRFFENLKKYNYELITPIDEIDTINSKVDVKFNGVIYKITFRNLADGYLPHKNNSIKIKDINDFKKKVFELVGDEFTVVEGEVYVNNKTPIKMIHKKCGRIIDTLTPGTFLNGGKRCKYCSKKYTPDINEIQKILKEKLDNEYEIVNINDYKNLTTKLKIKHKKCGKIYERTLNSIFKGKKCPFCSNAILKTQEDFENDIKIVGNDEFELVGKYIDCKTKVEIRHKICGCSEFIRPFDFLYNRKNKCLNCKVSKESLEEDNLRKFIESLGYKTKKLKKKINNKWYELDIFIESLNIGFEFNGIYWHSEGIAKEKLNLNKKMKAYNLIGIRVINIFEDEWLYKNNIIKEKIKSILHKNINTTIYARKCIIKEPTTKEKNNFLDLYHIQGSDKCNIKRGLYFNDELVAIMTFSKLRNSLGYKNKQNQNKYELSRFATKYHIPGGFSKLFKHIIGNFNILEVVTYADLRWSDINENVYTKNDFKLIHISRPNYWYHDGRKRYHRYNFRKQVLKDKFPDLYDEKLTEKQIMDKTKYKRIWDCGNLVYEWKRKDELIIFSFKVSFRYNNLLKKYNFLYFNFLFKIFISGRNINECILIN